MQKILVIDDDTDICLLLRRFLSKNGYEVAIAKNGNGGLALLEEFNPDLVMTDFRLGDMTGESILHSIKEKYPYLPVIIITGYSDIRTAVNVMKLGAIDYITKPLFPDEILITIQNALKKEIPLATNQIPNNVSVKQNTFLKTLGKEEHIFGNGIESATLFRQLDLVAPTNYSVIIYGESGSGKESIAQEIHLRSKRAKGPFIAMDCGAISKELAGSEMFGHEKGAFTGAINQKIGHFEMANGGTLFLDEVANLPYDVQVALLRVVQERKLRRIGGTKEILVDVRIIVASNERLLDSCKKGKFREDLYHRFNEFSIDVPPLRNRKADIMEYAFFFLAKTNEELDKQVKGFAPEVEEVFNSYSWPGNLREMRNVIKRATLLSEKDTIEAHSLPFEIMNHRKLLIFDNTSVVDTAPPEQILRNTPLSEHSLSLKSVASDAEYETIVQVLKQVNYNKSKAARLLGIDRKTLYNKMSNYNM
ncbi:sigma-54-dependent transcriptional regulator [Flectobacillus major]|uniref:sigma-54-dependent transcriptional regulator n=1 Tax=Flectobacillus major TaxID=103 RepID=UPI00041C2B90|nr:sigma-54 dependent transcriptional regulator [Flectobacillus major]